MSPFTRTAGLFALLVGAMSQQAAAQNWQFTPVADNTTPIPGGTGTFGGLGGQGFGSFPSIDQGNVSFIGHGLSGQAGVYARISNGLLRVADLNTVAPGSASLFTGFGDLENSSSGTTVTFTGARPGSAGGLYTYESGVLSVIADPSTPIPSGTGNFTGTVGVRSANGFSFNGTGASSQVGIYTAAPSLTMRANKSTPIPAGSGSFTNFGLPTSLRNDSVAFLGAGSSSQRGIYLSDAGNVLSKIADKNSDIPGNPGTKFTTFQAPAWFDDSTLAFYGDSGSSFRAIYSATAGILTRLVGVGDSAPDGGTFTYVSDVFSADAGTLLFRARTGSGSDDSIYYRDIFGGLHLVCKPGSIINGKMVDIVQIGYHSLSDNQGVLYADFFLGAEAVLTFNLPAPGVAMPFALGLLCISARRRR